MKNEASGHRARLRSRFEKSGFSGFNDYEVVELILTLCIPRCDVKKPAKSLINQFGSLRNVLDASTEELRRVEGIGAVAPTALKIVRETANAYLLETAEKGSILDNSDKLETFWMARLSHLTHEVFEVAYLDNSYSLVKNGVERLEQGTVDHAVVYPRKVVESALKRSASAIVLAHNHPSGAPNPSEQDFQLTRALVNAAGTLSIEVIDHIIICNKEVFSFRRSGFLGPKN